MKKLKFWTFHIKSKINRKPYASCKGIVSSLMHTLKKNVYFFFNIFEYLFILIKTICEGLRNRRYSPNFLSEFLNKRAKMALNRSPEFKGVTVQIVCVLGFQSDSA